MDSGEPSDQTAEWMRFGGKGYTQGQKQESLHPNYFGQRALGRCVYLYDLAANPNMSCRNTRFQGVEGMFLEEIK